MIALFRLEKVPSALEAHRGPVSSPCTAMAAHPEQQPPRKLRLHITHRSHHCFLPSFLPFSLILISNWYLSVAVSHSNLSSPEQSQSLSSGAETGAVLWGTYYSIVQKPQYWVWWRDNQERHTGLLEMKTEVRWKTLWGLSLSSVHTSFPEDSEFLT